MPEIADAVLYAQEQGWIELEGLIACASRKKAGADREGGHERADRTVLGTEEIGLGFDILRCKL